MPFDALFPSFPRDRFLFEDDDLVAIDKPAGTSTHAADERRDDAVSRVARAIAEREGVAEERVYLGVHQRLDRDTSGVLVFTKRKSANGKVAEQFEGRRVKKVYVAAVAGFRPPRPEGELRHVLVREDAATMRVARSPREKERGQLAVTRYRVLERVGERALVELRPETGRTHQLRVQLSASGGSIAGDRAYGGAPAERLMLHATSLTLAHPTSGRPLALRSAPPACFADWLHGRARDPLESVDSIERAMRAAADRRHDLARSHETTAFRLVHDAADGLPGVALDLYGEHLLLHLSSPAALDAREPLLDAASRLGARGVYVVSHPKQASTIVDPRAPSFAPAQAQRGDDARTPFIVLESGLSYLVRLGDGLKTGIFLDQRDNRRRVRELSGGKRVLNLFAYTCAFTVAAAAGGASRTVSVDATPGVLDEGLANLEANGLEGAHHERVAADAIAWMRRAAKDKARYDLVILDPPSFATTRTSRFSAESDYREVAALAFALLAPKGKLLACTNSRKLARAKLRRQLHEAARMAARTIVQMKDLPDPSDFPAPFGTEAHLKSVLVTIA